MTLRDRPLHVAGARALRFVALVGTAVWLGGPLAAQPDEGPQDLRAKLALMRAAIAASGASAVTDEITGQTTTVWGIASDVFIPADYDGDGKTDHAIWRTSPAPARFRILKSSDGTEMVVNIGQTGDDPSVVADYDGDGRIDAAVYRPATIPGTFGRWIYHPSNGGADVTIVCSATMDCGQTNTYEVPGDFNGDGKADFMIQRTHPGATCAVDNTQGTPAPFTPNADFLLTLNGGTTHTVIPCIGRSNDLVAPGDYDGDRMTDIALVRSTGGEWEWEIRGSAGPGYSVLKFGNSSTDVITQGDYDGDGFTDRSVWRPSLTPGASAFFVMPSASGMGPYTAAHGQNGDYPVANYNIH